MWEDVKDMDNSREGTVSKTKAVKKCGCEAIPDDGRVCGAVSEKGYGCTLRPKHRAKQHVACGVETHRLQVWKDAK